MFPGHGKDRTWTKRKLRLENQMTRTVSFGKLQKTIPLRLVVLISGHVKFYSFVFMHTISTRVVCANGNYTVPTPPSLIKP